MIHVIGVLDPHGSGQNLRGLGSLHIINDGTGTDGSGNYTVRRFARSDDPTKPGRLVKEARIENWPRNNVSAWQLIAKAVEVTK